MFLSFFLSLARRLRAWQTERALSGLSDRQLEDIGVSRGQIPWAARFSASEPADSARLG